MKCVIKASVITGENPRFSPISATGYNLSVLRRRVGRSVGSVSAILRAARPTDRATDLANERASAEISVQMNPAVITG